MALTNVERLTQGDRKYAAKKRAQKTEEVKFDPDSRKEFLTGFHKRKLARQAEGRRKAEELNRQLRLAERKRLREEKKAHLEKGLDRLKEAQEIIDGKTGTRFTEEEDHAEDSASRSSGEDEFRGFEENSGILKRRGVNYGDSTVTFEEINLDPYVDIARSEQVLDEATRKANEYAAYVSSIEEAEAKAAKKAQKTKSKKFRYLPKSERKQLNRKSKAR